MEQFKRDKSHKLDALISREHWSTGTINADIKTAAFWEALPKIAGASSSQTNREEGTLHAGTVTKQVTLLGSAQTTGLKEEIRTDDIKLKGSRAVTPESIAPFLRGQNTILNIWLSKGCQDFGNG